MNIGFSYNKIRLKPSQQIGCHRQDTWELSYIQSGQGMRSIGDTTEPFEAGEVVLIPPGITHRWAFDDFGEYIRNISIFINPSWLESCARAFPETSESLAKVMGYHSAVRYDGIGADRLRVLMTRMDRKSDIRKLSDMIEIIEVLATAENNVTVGTEMPMDIDEERRRQVRTFVICNYNKRISLDEVATYIGLGSSSFCRWMKQKMGMTFWEYLTDFRIGRAAEMLLSEYAMHASEVGYNCGFDDIPYFHRVFKAHTGMSPCAFRVRKRFEE